MSASSVAVLQHRTTSEDLVIDLTTHERLQPAKTSATSAPVVSVNLIPTVEEGILQCARPCDPHTRETLGQRMQRRTANLEHRLIGEQKNHGHRQAPAKKRGDTAKKRRIARDHKLAAAMSVERQRLADQLDEVANLLVRTRLAPGLS